MTLPLNYDIFKPIILMPKSTKWEDTKQIECILAHEFFHIKHFDAALKLLLTAALCIHWFNPLVWAMYFLSNRDIELFCDEAVVRYFGETTKSTYALTLIHMEEKKSTLTPLCNSFSKNAIENQNSNQPIQINGKEIAAGGKISLGSQLLAIHSIESVNGTIDFMQSYQLQ